MHPDIDHVIIAVPDLDQAALDWQRLGFTVTPKSSHPFGTANRLVVLQNGFIELLAVEFPDRLGRFKVVAEAIQLAGGSLPWGIVWTTSDIKQSHRRCCELNLQPSPLNYRVERDVVHPNGLRHTACFSSFGLQNGMTPTYHEAFSVQHNPEAVFALDWKQHLNGAQRLLNVCSDTDDTDLVGARLQPLFNDAFSSKTDSIEIFGGSSSYCIKKRTAGSEVGPRLRYANISVDNSTQFARVLQQENIEFERTEHGELNVPAQYASGLELRIIGRK